MALVEKRPSKSPEKVEDNDVSTEIKSKVRFFIKYPNGLTDQFGNDGKWYEVIKDDWMITMPCSICGELLLLRVDDPICTRCRSS